MTGAVGSCVRRRAVNRRQRQKALEQPAVAARLRHRVSGMSGAGDRGPRGVPGVTMWIRRPLTTAPIRIGRRPSAPRRPETVIPPGPRALDPQRGTLARRFHAVAN